MRRHIFSQPFMSKDYTLFPLTLPDEEDTRTGEYEHIAVTADSVAGPFRSAEQAAVFFSGGQAGIQSFAFKHMPQVQINHRARLFTISSRSGEQASFHFASDDDFSRFTDCFLSRSGFVLKRDTIVQPSTDYRGRLFRISAFSAAMVLVLMIICQLMITTSTFTVVVSALLVTLLALSLWGLSLLGKINNSSSAVLTYVPQ